VTGHTKQKVKL